MKKSDNGCGRVPVADLVNGNSEAESDTKILEPKEELQYLAEAVGFQVTFTDFPQKAAKSEFITLVKLSTKPPKVLVSAGLLLALADAASIGRGALIKKRLEKAYEV